MYLFYNRWKEKVSGVIAQSRKRLRKRVGRIIMWEDVKEKRKGRNCGSCGGITTCRTPGVLSDFQICDGEGEQRGQRRVKQKKMG